MNLSRFVADDFVPDTRARDRTAPKNHVSYAQVQIINDIAPAEG
jgi:hypothetical protein